MIELLATGAPDGRREPDHEALCAVIQNQRLAFKAFAPVTLHNVLLCVIPDRAFELTVSKQELNGPEIPSPPID